MSCYLQTGLQNMVDFTSTKVHLTSDQYLQVVRGKMLCLHNKQYVYFDEVLGFKGFILAVHVPGGPRLLMCCCGVTRKC